MVFLCWGDIGSHDLYEYAWEEDLELLIGRVGRTNANKIKLESHLKAHFVFPQIIYYTVEYDFKLYS